MIVTSDRDCPELYYLFSAYTFDGKFSSTGYSQLQAILICICKGKPQPIRVHQEPTGSSTATLVIYAIK